MLDTDPSRDLPPPARAADAGALVLVSGGQDSAVCLAWALDRYRRVETVGFEYGQRHRAELAARGEVIAAMRGLHDWGGRLGADHLLDLAALGAISDTALTREAAIGPGAGGLPTTFVPGRNLIFLTFAAAIACRRGLARIVGGMGETDYSGYPDCRDDTLKALQVAINLGMASRLVIEAPLMWIDKAEAWRLAERLGGAGLVALIRDRTLSCYRGDTAQRHVWGMGCGACPACALRRAGWERYAAGC